MTLLMAINILLVAWAALPYVRLPAPAGFMLLVPRLLASALSPVLAVAGATAAVVALALGHWLPALVGALAAAAALRVWVLASWPRSSSRQTFSPAAVRRPGQGRSRGAAGRQRRWPWRAPGGPEPRLSANLPFGTVPGTSRQLVCDLWQPAAGVAPSGLAYIYLHGSAWYILDKDVGTRTMFRRLCAQGHLVLDVAYRLFPETDLEGMLGDVKRAVAWLKQHAADYGVDPARIVLGGGSAGGHLALLAAYAPHQPALTPSDVQGANLSVCGVAAFYGPADLAACFTHTNQHRAPRRLPNPRDFSAPAPAWLERLAPGAYDRLGLGRAAVAGRLDWLLGGTPEEVPERYALLSPITHGHAGCPPTLLVQGADDLITPVAATRALLARLQAAEVPVDSLILPHTDHGFDLVLPRVSPSAQAALHELEAFLSSLTPLCDE